MADLEPTLQAQTIPYRYPMGAEVWGIHVWRMRVRDNCPVCDARGKVKVEDHDMEATCPNCRGLGDIERTEHEPVYQLRSLTIGRVTAQYDGSVVEVRYMCEETGIGSGTNWPEERLFPTHKEAVAAAHAEGAVERVIA